MRVKLIIVATIGLLLLAPVAQSRVPAHKQSWQYKWEVWLPDNWQRVGACETGDGKRPGNWHHHNSSYVSAFGIQRGSRPGQYDHDARLVGMPPWNDARPPTPWQQYRTALSHYHQYGDGWGCPGP